MRVLKNWWTGRTALERPMMVALAVAVTAGFIGLGTTVGWLLSVALLVAAVAVALRWFGARMGNLIGALVLGAIGLLGVNVVLAAVLGLIHVKLPILVGLIIAVPVFAAVAASMLVINEWPRLHASIAGVALALLVIIGLPVLIGSRATTDTAAVVSKQQVGSTLDVAIVTAGGTHVLPPELPVEANSGFDLRYSVGVADGDGVRWTLLGATTADQAIKAIAAGPRAIAATGGSPKWRGKDTVVVLDVDDTPVVATDPATLDGIDGAPGEVSRWRRIARAAGAPPGTPTFALLQTRADGRLADWQSFMADGQPVSVQTLASPTVTDAALRLGIGAPDADGLTALAVQFRPILLFDRGEPVPRPLSIDDLFRNRDVTLCRDDSSHTTCAGAPTTNPGALVNGATHLRLQLPGSKALRALALKERGQRPAATPVPAQEPGAPPDGTPPPAADAGAQIGEGSAIYFHPVRRNNLIYLDYWWYLPDNPAHSGAGGFCGPGLVISGITCHNHQSDWEGMTVVVDPAGPTIQTVQYAQHDHVFAYPWAKLRARWQQQERAFLDAVPDSATRPLAFSARGTHATYPYPCAGDCHQTHASLAENAHDGAIAWAGNTRATCGDEPCLRLLPTRDGGNEPALWNDFHGAWGDRECVFRYFCDSGSPPAAPGQQRRYQHPDAVTGNA